MQWIHQYQLFLFDFDGLLVNTEELHYQAYINMCASRGFSLTWDFNRYSEAAHHSANGLKDQIYAEFPTLYKQEPNWIILYQEKKTALLQLLESQTIPLMPGVKQLLLSLQESNIKRCVVTHSTKALVNQIRQKNPILNSIPHWITREDYINPKPHPECYLAAIHQFSTPEDKVIGFEDSPRGLKALSETTAKPVLICPSTYPYLKDILSHTVYYPSFDAITEESHP